MAGLSWFPVAANLRSHRKAMRLAAMLGDPRAHTWLVDMWGWAYHSEPSGTLHGDDAGRIIEMAVGWTGEPDRLWKAMVAAGWLDAIDGGLHIHDWEEHAGPLMAKAERDADRARERRAKMTGRFAPKARRADVAQNPADVAATSRGRRADVRQNSGDVAGNSNPNPNPNPNTLPSEEISSPSPLLTGGASRDQNPPAQSDFSLSGTEPKSSDPVEDLRDLWNSLKAPEQPLWRETSAKRHATALARLNDRPLRGSDSSWEAVFQRLAASSFARGLRAGANGDCWRASPDFFLKPDSAGKVLEGMYDDRGGPSRLLPEPAGPPCAAPGCANEGRSEVPGAGAVCGAHMAAWMDSAECADAPSRGFAAMGAAWLERLGAGVAA